MAKFPVYGPDDKEKVRAMTEPQDARRLTPERVEAIIARVEGYLAPGEAKEQVLADLRSLLPQEPTMPDGIYAMNHGNGTRSLFFVKGGYASATMAMDGNLSPTDQVYRLREEDDRRWTYLAPLDPDETHVEAKTAAKEPHARACGVTPHAHGPHCHRNCPTCGGLSVLDGGLILKNDKEAEVRCSRQCPNALALRRGGRTIAAIKQDFESKGWVFGPTRCPMHSGRTQPDYRNRAGFDPIDGKRI